MSRAGHVGKDPLDRLTPLAGLLLDAADELVEIAGLDLEVVASQLPPRSLRAPQLFHDPGSLAC